VPSASHLQLSSGVLGAVMKWETSELDLMSPLPQRLVLNAELCKVGVIERRSCLTDSS
jgi:hypothetical protein